MLAAEHLPERYNAAAWFVERNVREGRGDALAAVSDAFRLTYRQLDEAVRRCATMLRGFGVQPGNRVAVIAPDGLPFCIGFWGAIAVGAVAVPLNTLLRAADYRQILADCEPAVLLVDSTIVDGAALDFAGPRVAWTVDDMQRRLAEIQPADKYASTHRDSPAFILYTSGTTGEPKGAVHLQHDMWVCCETFAKTVLGIKPNDRCFSIAKLFFAYGLGNAQYFPFHVGASAVLLSGRPTPETVFEHVRKHCPTLFFGVPTAYANLLAALETGATADFSSVRLCISAGEALPAALFERWRARTGLEILDGLGSTEVCQTFLSNRAGDCRPGSSGKAVTGYDLRIVDDTGSDVARGEIGSLLVRGDSTMAFYWNKHEATKRVLKGDWIGTGDRYRQDVDGYFWHCGRGDDLLKVGGIWVSPIEVESVLVSHPKVLECAVVGVGNAQGLVKPHAFVTLRPGADATDLEDELKAFAKENLAAYKCPHRVSVVADLPKTATGKIQRFLLRAHANPSRD